MCGVVVLHDLDGELRIALHALEHIEPAASSLAFGAVLGVGDHLQLAQDELGDDERAFEKSCLSHVGDAAVDDGAGVQYLDVALGGTAFCVEEIAERVEVEQVSLAGSDDQADVGT